MIAPSRAEKTTASPKYCDFTVDATVLATAVPKIMNATKLNAAAHRTASRGRSTRVATMVEMEFAESWNPFV